MTPEQLPKSVREAAARARYEQDRADHRGWLPWDYLSEDVREDYRLATDPILAALLDACEVREEWGWREADGNEHFTYWADEPGVDYTLAENPDAGYRKIRRLVITTAAEDVTGEVGRG